MEHINMMNQTSAAATSAPAPLLMLLETSIPGVSILSRFLSEYLHIDLSQYLGLFLLIVGLTSISQSVEDKIKDLRYKFLMSSAEVRYNDEIYNFLMFWISKHGLSQHSRHVIAGTQTNSSQVYTNDDNDGEDFEPDMKDMTNAEIAEQCQNWDRMKTLRFTPATGTHWFRYRGHWILFTRVQEKEQGFYGATTADSISLSCFGWSAKVVKDLLQEAQVAYVERDGNKTVLYRGIKGWGGSADDMEWIRGMARPPRHMSTVVLDQAQKDLILADMKEYLHPQTKRWYSDRGIPYRRGYLLHGPPGTGKTSLCFALAGLLHLRIYVASLNSKTMTEDGLSSLFRNLPSRCIVLLEDVDAAGLTMKREDTTDPKAEPTEEAASKPSAAAVAKGVTTAPAETPKGITLSGFLNIIDGVASAEGRILIMTTNHIEKLDAALLRPGRVDLNVYFGRAKRAVLNGMFMAIYANVCDDVSDADNGRLSGGKEAATDGSSLLHRGGMRSHGKTEREICALASQFAESVPEDIFTPAEIQGYLLKHKVDPQGALDGCQELIASKEKLEV